MKIKNYTSTVPSDRSRARIQQVLVERQDEGRRMQADRTAWKLLQDWVEVQASLIRIGMSTATEVFLPYMLVGSGKTQHTFWAHLSSRSGGLLAITQEAGK